MIKIGICDDDISFAKEFEAHINQFYNKYSKLSEEIKCIYYKNSDEIIEKFSIDNIDVYFLDIEYGQELGIDVARKLGKLRQDIGIVYMTNYEHYVTKAFVCRPLGFVRKQHVEEDMVMTMVSVCEYIEKDRRVLEFLDNSKEVNLKLGDIKYIQMQNHTMEIDMINNKLEIRDKISRIENTLCSQGFIKINRSCLVNSKYIEDMKAEKIKLYDGTVLYCSADKKNEVFIEWQNNVMMFGKI